MSAADLPTRRGSTAGFPWLAAALVVGLLSLLPWAIMAFFAAQSFMDPMEGSTRVVLAMVLAYPLVVGGFTVAAWKAWRRADTHRTRVFAMLAITPALLILAFATQMFRDSY